MSEDVKVSVTCHLARETEKGVLHGAQDKHSGEGKVTIEHPAISFHRTSHLDGTADIREVRAHALIEVAGWCNDQAAYLIHDNVRASSVEIDMAEDGTMRDIVKFPCKDASDWEVAITGAATTDIAEQAARATLCHVLNAAAVTCSTMSRG